MSDPTQSRLPHFSPQIISNVVKPAPSAALLAWLEVHKDEDLFIAAVAAANDCVVVTDNDRDFADIGLINPLKGSG